MWHICPLPDTSSPLSRIYTIADVSLSVPKLYFVIRYPNLTLGAGQQGPTRTLTAALKRLIEQLLCT